MGYLSYTLMWTLPPLEFALFVKILGTGKGIKAAIAGTQALRISCYPSWEAMFKVES